jgi:hypothetical protein
MVQSAQQHEMLSIDEKYEVQTVQLITFYVQYLKF